MPVTEARPAPCENTGTEFAATAVDGCSMATSRKPSTGPSGLIPLSLIHRDALGWPRKHLDAERIDEFEDLYLEHGPNALPLIEVVPDGDGSYIVADGNHRVEAISVLDIDAIEVVVLAVPHGTTPLDVCFERGLVTAARSPLRLTRSEKHAAILHLKTTRAALSNREISMLVGCSHQTVGRVLERSIGPDEVPVGDPLPPSDLEVASQLLRGIERIYAARGLGIWDALTHDHTGERLADVLERAYGEGALRFAERVRVWLDEAISKLEGRS